MGLFGDAYRATAVLCDFKLALRCGIGVPEIALFNRRVMRVGPFFACLNNLIVFQKGPSLDFSLFEIQQMQPKSQFALVAGTFVGMGCLFLKDFTQESKVRLMQPRA
nr:hypothetical protein [Gemmobacter tilapiae]